MGKQSAITINQLTVAYDARPVLWNITASLPKEKLTAIIGPNGAGKSTLIKSMVDFIKPITGNVLYQIEDEVSQTYKEVKENKLGEVINTNQTEEYVEVTVTYEVIEKIGTEEKIQF